MKLWRLKPALFLIGILAVAAYFSVQALLPAPQHPTVGGSNIACPHTPCASQFGLTYSRGTVNSAYAYESGLVDGRAPVADTDLMLPYAAQELVKLPGERRDHYTLEGVNYISGSGWYETFSTPNGGRFALLHLSSTAYLASASGVHPRLAGTLRLGPPTTGSGDVTGVYRSYYVGGMTIATSGWPTAAQYANGAPGPGDAHLCV
ncbi:MAG: hypothetical protein ACRDFS_10695, partial [Chloroflexota bacterium]